MWLRLSSLWSAKAGFVRSQYPNCIFNRVVYDILHLGGKEKAVEVKTAWFGAVWKTLTYREHLHSFPTFSAPHMALLSGQTGSSAPASLTSLTCENKIQVLTGYKLKLSSLGRVLWVQPEEKQQKRKKVTSKQSQKASTELLNMCNSPKAYQNSY